MLADVK